eukprot:TRINITY_DN13441_c0_g1_i2.p1 TRINITY_DN13441_c0_g1~~TRINITY_DN13441_c0_g1_i2.p1  ORF type:complete len:1201 (+),score=302.66 TRINITY_DN13441_c0_g1_i2:73-3603(+)
MEDATDRASRTAQRLRSRHLELLQRLGQKNKEKNECERRDAERLRRRQTLLRDRLVKPRPATDPGQQQATVPPLPAELSSHTSSTPSLAGAAGRRSLARANSEGPEPPQVSRHPRAASEDPKEKRPGARTDPSEGGGDSLRRLWQSHASAASRRPPLLKPLVPLPSAAARTPPQLPPPSLADDTSSEVVAAAEAIVLPAPVSVDTDGANSAMPPADSNAVANEGVSTVPAAVRSPGHEGGQGDTGDDSVDTGNAGLSASSSSRTLPAVAAAARGPSAAAISRRTADTPKSAAVAATSVSRATTPRGASASASRRGTSSTAALRSASGALAATATATMATETTAVVASRAPRPPLVPPKVVNVAAMRQCADIADWKRRNGHPLGARVFCCFGGYFDFRDAMISRGWVENTDKESRFFDLRWGMAGDIDHASLEPHQIANHFERAVELTTKSGLSLNLRSSRWYSNVDIDEYYPRAFDLRDPLDRADFVLDFKLTKAESIVRGFIERLEAPAVAGTEDEVIFSQEVVDLAMGILERQVRDLDDVIDLPKAERAYAVSEQEWAVLSTVNLDDPATKLENIFDAKMLEATISRKSTLRRLTIAAKTQEELVVQKKAVSTKKKSKKKSKKKKKKVKPVEMPLSCAAASLRGTTDGQGLLTRARDLIECLGRRNPQAAINGSRNAWIVKPAGKSRGRGIQMLRELEEIFRNTESEESQWICQKYIEQPQTPFGYKFDVRQWVLVTDWNPLTVYVWRQPYIRFAGEKYDSSLVNRNQYMHLVNNSIVKNMDGFNEEHEELGTAGYMWFRQQYEAWLHAHLCKRSDCQHCTPFLGPPPYTCEFFGVRWEECRYVDNGGDDESDEDDSACAGAGSGATGANSTSGGTGGGAASASAPKAKDEPVEAPRRKERYEPPEPDPRQPRTGRCMPPRAPEGEESCEDYWETCVFPQIKDIILWSLRSVMDIVEPRKNTAELYGYDFMFSCPGEGEKPRVWLIEVNSSPAMDYSTKVTTPLVKKVMEDTARVLADLRENPSASTGEWELLRHDGERQFVGRQPTTGVKLELHGTAIVPRRRRKKSKKMKKPKKKEEASAAADAEVGSAKGGTEKSKENEPENCENGGEEDDDDGGEEEDDDEEAADCDGDADGDEDDDAAADADADEDAEDDGDADEGDEDDEADEDDDDD